MAPKSTRSSQSCNPAPYGRACVGCSRAKCKCFYRSEGSGCERCYRLGKFCEPSTTVRRRKARTSSQATQPSSTRLVEELGNRRPLLRSHAVEKQTGDTQFAPQSMAPTQSLPSTQNTPISHSDVMSLTTARDPDIVLDTANSVVELLRPGSSHVVPSIVHNDVSTHKIPGKTAEEQLEMFRRVFLPVFPFVYIPAAVSSEELRHNKPFLWLVIMSLTTKLVSQQFAMEETIWQIISQRIVSQHLADLDLLLGVICFASWSHYFKQEKPFMTMLAQMALSLAFELDIHHDVPLSRPRQSRGDRPPVQQIPRQHNRTLEERRTMLAVFHLTSSTWAAYRKTEPSRWTPYMDRCLRILYEVNESELDSLLGTQVKCHMITNQLIRCPGSEVGEGDSLKALSPVLVAALMEQLNQIRRTMPGHIRSTRSAQVYLYNTELTIQETLLRRPKSKDSSGLSSIQRIQDLDAVLSCVERWLAVFAEASLSDWVGISVDHFTQLTHCLVVLFKLTTLGEPGWDLEEVRRRADLFGVLDRFCETTNRVTVELGMVDAGGPRRGLFFKTTYLLQAIKALFLSEMPPEMIPVDSSGGGSGVANSDSPDEFVAGPSLSDDFILSLADEPWLSDIMGSPWDFGFESSLDIAFIT